VPVQGQRNHLGGLMGGLRLAKNNTMTKIQMEHILIFLCFEERKPAITLCDFGYRKKKRVCETVPDL
jgi:hypothetical protein